MSISKLPEGLISLEPDKISLSLEDELRELLVASSSPEFNLSVRNYEWVVSAAFDALRVDSDQSFKQADFVVSVINTLFPTIKLLGGYGTYDVISGILDRTIKRLHERLIDDRLYIEHRFPYVPVTYLSATTIVFNYQPNDLPFVFKGVNMVVRG